MAASKLPDTLSCQRAICVFYTDPVCLNNYFILYNMNIYIFYFSPPSICLKTKKTNGTLARFRDTFAMVKIWEKLREAIRA